MQTPRIEINLKQISHNAKKLRKLYASKGIELIGVTKSVCGDPAIADILTKTGIKILADSRISNIKRMKNAGIKAQFLLLRTPALSEVRSVIQYSDISLNSELSVIKKLSKFAIENKVLHKIILMVEMGDLREGIMPVDLIDMAKQVISLKGIKLAGIGTSFACFGGVKPDQKKIEFLSTLAKNIEDKFGQKLEFISGGNSANYDWFMSIDHVGKVNNLRIGESIFLGCETIHRKPIPGLYTNSFKLIAEVIESKIKPSKPYGEICQDAFGNIPSFADLGQRNRAILGIGRQDVLVSGLIPDYDIDILGASSDHLIIDTKNIDLRVGNEIKFNLNYGSLLSSMTSPYIKKKYCQKVEKELYWPHKYAMVTQ